METIVLFFVPVSKEILAGLTRRFNALTAAAGKRALPFESIVTIRLRSPRAEMEIWVAVRSAAAGASAAEAAS